MSEIKQILIATCRLPDGDIVKGPVTTRDFITFLFRNRFTSLDFYIEMRKSSGVWEQIGVQEIEYSNAILNDIGRQIDKVLSKQKEL